ncbi:MAG: cupin domain-containing protein [Armatimonadetes bacterium]|nr:cupin domain-containing protein [Armatimonadota bacterium]
MPFFDLGERPEREIFPGVTIRTCWGERIMLSFVQFQRAGAVVPTHQHPHEQMGMGIEGEFELEIDGEARIIHPGDTYCVPGNTPHRARSVGGPARALDIFAPVREDYK